MPPIDKAGVQKREVVRVSTIDRRLVIVAVKRRKLMKLIVKVIVVAVFAIILWSG